jgi:hypothetical protein
MTDEKKVSQLALEIAKLSAGYDPDEKTWLGFDTDIGDLPEQIKSVLKKWAIAIVKEFDKKSEKCDPKTEQNEFVSLRVMIEFLINKFELTEENLK